MATERSRFRNMVKFCSFIRKSSAILSSRCSSFLLYKIKQLEGTVTVYEEGVDFFVEVSNDAVTVQFRRIGYFLLSVITSTSQENSLLSVGMRPSCENVFTPPEDCSNEGDLIPPGMIERPPNNECHLFSHEAVFYTDDDGNAQKEPIGSAVIVKTCDDIVEAVCKKFRPKEARWMFTLKATETMDSLTLAPSMDHLNEWKRKVIVTRRSARSCRTRSRP